MKSRYLQQGMYAAVFTVAAVQVNAASPVDFSNLVEQVSPVGDIQGFVYIVISD